MADSVTYFCHCVQLDRIDNYGFLCLSLVNSGRADPKMRGACWLQSHVYGEGAVGTKTETFTQAEELTDTLLQCGRVATVLGIWRLRPSSGFTSEQLCDFGHGD